MPVFQPLSVQDSRMHRHHAGRLASSNDPVMVLGGLGSKVMQGVELGAVGAVVAASLSAFTEPIINRVRVKREGVRASVQQFQLTKARSFFKTTLSTNLLKFPLYEAINAAMLELNLPLSVRGGATGAVFTTATLPITNYRQCKSVDIDISECYVDILYAAYLPTLVRDIIYGVSRNLLLRRLTQVLPSLGATAQGRALMLFIAVFGACLVSSPGNELRGYYLQPPEQRLGLRAFFRPRFYLKSTLLGSTVMATGLSGGRLVTAYVNRLLRGGGVLSLV